ncbi:MAG: DegT/DnrJ/EryC1/StrS family aminotransferase [Chitinophagaceae bacterium]|nr:DegT/DnrJ/EryC1/StrS family aminotransferase [Chitinophagaceae bacterium]MCA6459668.1 DegT/DnrJ/EryC1/StrS family aminotransferase [Chitinophagaceae bacterium]MCA6464535.1 DegT/DnrJ/EryC1/StrS family aminotransferase [Chitinophagaceae bacterium]
MSNKINCLDLQRQHQFIKAEVFELFEKVYSDTAFSGGKFVDDFENEFATFCNTRFSIGVNNGTSALHLTLMALGIKSGDEVIVPANTFIATAWAVSYVGATPVFVDCTSDTWEIDPEVVEAKITNKTKAIIGVHLYGQPFDIDAISAIAKKHNLFLVEDAAQAHGAEYKGKRVGSFGEMACFSFYPGKNLGACGEAGGISTNSEVYNKHLRSLRNHGSTVRYHHDEIGYNMRMGGLEAASLSVKIKYISQWNQRRQAIAKRYHEEITNDKICMQKQPEWTKSIYHLFVVTTDDRASLMKYLNDHDINPGLHYPIPCHLQKAYSYLGYQKGSLPNAEYLAEHCLSLPMFAEMNDEEVNHVIETLNKY